MTIEQFEGRIRSAVDADSGNTGDFSPAFRRVPLRGLPNSGRYKGYKTYGSTHFRMQVGGKAYTGRYRTG